MFEDKGTGWVNGLLPTSFLFGQSEDHIASAASRVGLPYEVTLPRDLWVTDQQDEESCMAQLGIGMIYELTGVKCSGYVPWYMARVKDNGGPTGVRNTGISADAFLMAMEKHGACLEQDWNRSSTGWEMNGPPGGIASVKAQKRKLDVVPIYAYGASAVTAMQAALADFMPGGVVICADAVYRNPDSMGRVGPAQEFSRWFHGVRIRGYVVDDDGVVWFRSPGSWGAGLGIGGEVWLHESRIARSPFICFGRSCT